MACLGERLFLARRNGERLRRMNDGQSSMGIPTV